MRPPDRTLSCLIEDSFHREGEVQPIQLCNDAFGSFQPFSLKEREVILEIAIRMIAVVGKNVDFLAVHGDAELDTRDHVDGQRPAPFESFTEASEVVVIGNCDCGQTDLPGFLQQLLGCMNTVRKCGVNVQVSTTIICERFTVGRSNRVSLSNSLLHPLPILFNSCRYTSTRIPLDGAVACGVILSKFLAECFVVVNGELVPIQRNVSRTNELMQHSRDSLPGGSCHVGEVLLEG